MKRCFMHPFFPDAVFAWIFYLLVVGITLIASYTDVRRMIVPKWLTLPALILGLLMHTLRGAFGEDGAWQGLLFSLGGFGVGFGVFFVMFFLGTCRGGDVK